MKWIGTQTIYDHVRLNKGITLDSVSITTIQSSGESFADNDTSLMTSAAIDDRINTAVTAEDLDLTADSGTAAVDLNSQALAVTGGTGITTSATGQAVTLNVDAAQSGITSLGTLTGLILDGNKDVTPGDGAMIHVDNCDITDSNTSASGTAAKYTHVNIESPRLLATNSSVTTTAAATLYIQDAPAAASNQTIDNPYALWVDAGLVQFDGALTVGGTITGNVTGNVTGNTSGSSGSCTGQAATVATIAGLAPNTATTQATQPNITTLAGLTTIGATGVDTVINSDTFNFYDDVNNGNPIFSIGSSAANRLMIQAVYESGGKLLDYMQFKTYTASSTANAGRFLFSVDDVGVLTITDGGIQGLDSINMNASGTLAIDGTSFISDSSSGTFTLQNIDVLDATTEATIESAIDTLSNLTTVGTIGTGTWEASPIEGTYIENASATATGAVELATTAETTTGTDTVRAVTPDGLKDGYQGSANVTTLGTITNGTWNGTKVSSVYANTGGRRYGNVLKILPQDFMVNHDVLTEPLTFKDGGNSGVAVSNTASEMIAFIAIPEGMKATALDIYATNNKAVKIFEIAIDSSFDFDSATANESGNANTQITINPAIDATALNYLAIIYVATATTNRIWGGALTIAPQ